MALLGLFLLELVLVAPAIAQQQAPSSPVISPPSKTSWTGSGIMWLAVAILLGVVPAAVRLDRWFHPFIGLGVYANVWSGLYLSSMSLLSAMSYSQITALRSLSSALGGSTPDLMRGLSAVGGGSVSHAFIGLGRLGKRRVPDPTSPNQPETPRATVIPNFFLASIHDAIGDRLRERMHSQIRRLAGAYPWVKIRDVCCQLLEDQMTLGLLPRDEGQKVIRQIRSLPIASEQDQANSKYTALRLTIAKSSFRALRSRLHAERTTH